MSLQKKYEGETTEIKHNNKLFTVSTRRLAPRQYHITSIKVDNGVERFFTKHLTEEKAIRGHERFCERVDQFGTDWLKYHEDETAFCQEEIRLFKETVYQHALQEEEDEKRGISPLLHHERADTIHNLFRFGNNWKMYDESRSIELFSLKESFDEFVIKTQFKATPEDEDKFVKAYREKSAFKDGLHTILVFTGPDITAIENRQPNYMHTHLCILTRGPFIVASSYSTPEDAEKGHKHICWMVPRFGTDWKQYIKEINKTNLAREEEEKQRLYQQMKRDLASCGIRLHLPV